MNKILQLLSSYKTTVFLLLLYALLMAVATFVEAKVNTTAAKIIIYYSLFFILLQFLLIVNFILIFIEKQFIRKRKWSLVTIHIALIIILLGAFITHVFGKEGTIHIREGEKNDTMTMHTSKGVFEEKLPFVLELTDFRLIRYPGSNSPSSFESDLKIHLDSEIREANVYMNKILDVKGYRFFQSSYDDDEKGTILSVNKDFYGRTVTYIGYSLLLIGFILMFILPNSRLWFLRNQLKEVRNSVKLIAIFLIFSIAGNAQNFADNQIFRVAQQNTVPLEHAEKFGKIPIQLRGRIVPMSTFSSEILRKLHKSERIGNLNSDQFLLGFLAKPELWTQVPFISISNEKLVSEYQLYEKYFSYSQVFHENGSYKLLEKLNKSYQKPLAERTDFDKELIKIDEEINAIYLLLNHKIPAIFPQKNDPNHTWYASGDTLTGFSQEDSLFVSHSFPLYLQEVRNSLENGNWQKSDSILASIVDFQRKSDSGKLINDKKIQAEYNYNKQNIFAKVRLGYLIFGVFLLICTFALFIKKRKWLEVVAKTLTLGILLVFIYHLFGIILRWYISGYAPWSNSYETMVYVAWATVLVGFIFGRKSYITLALATLFSGVILFVSGLNWMNPQISPLIPVLKSPWLMFHVAVTVMAYGFFGISFLLGIVNLFTIAFDKTDVHKKRVLELSIINNMSLLSGLALMTLGTFIGAVWANESWGRYWGWDPKETWALITIVVYTVVTHVHLLKKWDKPWLFNLLSVIAFFSVLMTYIGVNYFLSGMHSYA